MAEWFKAPSWKGDVRASVPKVRILPIPFVVRDADKCSWSTGKVPEPFEPRRHIWIVTGMDEDTRLKRAGPIGLQGSIP